MVPAVELRGKPEFRRARFHTSYRMIYQISRAQKRVIVARIQHGSTAYDGMKN
jgi:mRNA-degrading endonuclease RelE of RelBE toxin-antitoxin system